MTGFLKAAHSAAFSELGFPEEIILKVINNTLSASLNEKASSKIENAGRY
jgi:hypothetical protein